MAVDYDCRLLAQADPGSFYHWLRELLATRKADPAWAQAPCLPLATADHRGIAIMRKAWGHRTRRRTHLMIAQWEMALRLSKGFEIARRGIAQLPCHEEACSIFRYLQQLFLK